MPRSGDKSGLRTGMYRFGFAFLLLSIGTVLLLRATTPATGYWLEGDGSRYVQIAIQIGTFGRLGLMPEFGHDFSRVYPPLLPAGIAVAKLITGEYYYAARAVVIASLILAVVGAFFLAKVLSQSSVSALLAGAAAALFLVPRNSTAVLTEPLATALLLGCLLAIILGFWRTSSATRILIYIAALLLAAGTLCRSQGAAVGISIAAALVFTLPREELGARARDLAILGCGWLAGVILYLAYERYMRSLGGEPLHTLLHAYTALLYGSSRYWPLEYFDPKSGLVSLVPAANSLWPMFRDDPGAYIRLSWITLKSSLTQWFVILLAWHMLRILVAFAKQRTRRNMLLFCDICLVVLFLLNTAILCVVSQHPIFIPRMFDPWVVCSLTVHAAVIGRLFALPMKGPLILKVASVSIALAAVGSQYGQLRAWVEDIATRHRGGGIADNVIESLKKDVPAKETVISSRVGGPDIAVSIAGYPDMYFDGPPPTFRTQMRANGIRYALVAPHVTPNAKAYLPDCSVLFDYPYNTLFVCPLAQISSKPSEKPRDAP
jgi:hypothetical protein